MFQSSIVIIRVPRVKPVFVILWIAFGLVAMMHGPLDVPGDFAESLSCLAGVAVMGNSGESSVSVTPDGESACRWISRTGNIPPVTIAKSSYTRLMCMPTNAVIKQKIPGGELTFLLANWQFWRRTALAPRAPSFLV